MDKYERCKRCKHYLEHYVISGTRFNPIGGHCINKELYNPRKRRNYELIENCEHWEINTEVKEKQKERIKDVFIYLKEHLSHIEQILQLDETKE